MSNAIGKMRWILDVQLFVATVFSTGNFDLLMSYPEYFGRIFDELGIGLLL